jgi:hypothetical protein
MAKGDVAVGPELAGNLARAQFMRRVRVGVEEMDHQRLAAGIAQAKNGNAKGIFVEGRQHPAPGIQPLGHLQPQVAGDDGGEGPVHSVGLWSGAAAKFQDVAEACGGDKAGLCQLAFEDGVGGGGGAVNDEVDPGKIGPGAVESRQNPAGLVRQRGRHLGKPDRARDGIEDHEVGEGAAHIDACNKSGLAGIGHSHPHIGAEYGVTCRQAIDIA